MDIASLALLLAVLVVGALVQGTIGIGFALIVVPVLAFQSPELLPTAVLVLMLPINLVVIARERAGIDWRGVGWVSLGRVLGTFGGLWLLATASARQIDIFIGLSLLAAVAASLLAPNLVAGSRTLAGAGLVTGVTETATGIGGPPLALAYQHAPPPIMRPTVAVCMLLGQLFSLATLLVNGLITLDLLGRIATLLPAVLFGLWLSAFTGNRLPHRQLRYALLAFAAVSGTLLLF